MYCIVFILFLYELFATISVNGSFQQNDYSVITEVMIFKSPQKNVVMNNTDLLTPIKIENIKFHFVHQKTVSLKN